MTDDRLLTDFLALIGRFSGTVFLFADIDVDFLGVPCGWRRRRRVHVRLRRPERGRRSQIVVVVERTALYGRLRPVRVVVERLGAAADCRAVRGLWRARHGTSGQTPRTAH